MTPSSEQLIALENLLRTWCYCAAEGMKQCPQGRPDPDCAPCEGADAVRTLREARDQKPTQRCCKLAAVSEGRCLECGTFIEERALDRKSLWAVIEDLKEHAERRAETACGVVDEEDITGYYDGFVAGHENACQSLERWFAIGPVWGKAMRLAHQREAREQGAPDAEQSKAYSIMEKANRSTAAPFTALPIGEGIWRKAAEGLWSIIRNRERPRLIVTPESIKAYWEAGQDSGVPFSELRPGEIEELRLSIEAAIPHLAVMEEQK
jgi:hypothetical protein